jgi:DHA2 family multidrug resistance protein
MFNTVKTLSGAAATGLLEGLGIARDRFHSSMLVDRLGNSALVTSQSIDADHGLGELAHHIHEQAVVLTSADPYRVLAGIAVAFLLVIPLLPVRSYPPWSTSRPLPAKRRYICHLSLDFLPKQFVLPRVWSYSASPYGLA